MKNFTRISNDIIRDPDLSNAAFRMYCVIRSHDQTKFDINREFLCKQCGNISLSTAKYTLKELQEKTGLIVHKIRFGETYHYKYEFPADNFQPTKSEPTISSQLETVALKNTILKEDVSEQKKTILKAEESIQASLVKEKVADQRLLELIEEIIGFNPSDNKKKALKALKEISKQSDNPIRLTPLTRLNYNINNIIQKTNDII